MSTFIKLDGKNNEPILINTNDISVVIKKGVFTFIYIRCLQEPIASKESFSVLEEKMNLLQKNANAWAIRLKR